MADTLTKATLIGLLIGTSLAIVAAMGPLVSAITITVGVETQVGDASGLPDARMLPAALEGVGAVALIFLLTRRPAGNLRAWCAALILVSLGAGMAAQGAHAVWCDERSHRLELPWNARLLVSFVPPISGLATLHLLAKMAEDLIGTIRLLLAHDAHVVAPLRLSPNGTRPLSAATGRVDGRVLRMVRANPRATWRVVKDSTGLSEANAKRALTAARRKLRNAAGEAQVQQALEPSDATGRKRGRPPPVRATAVYRGIPYAVDLECCLRALVWRQVEGELASLKDLADRVGVSRSTVSRSFAGHSTTLSTTLRILAALRAGLPRCRVAAETRRGRVMPGGRTWPAGRHLCTVGTRSVGRGATRLAHGRPPPASMTQVRPHLFGVDSIGGVSWRLANSERRLWSRRENLSIGLRRTGWSSVCEVT